MKFEKKNYLRKREKMIMIKFDINQGMQLRKQINTKPCKKKKAIIKIMTRFDIKIKGN
jgi:hypothetical protein